jgi:hypothetical protein
VDQSLVPGAAPADCQLLRERICPRICRAVGVSLTRLLHCMVACLTACPDDVLPSVEPSPLRCCRPRLAAEADARWRFVQKKRTNKELDGMEAKTRQHGSDKQVRLCPSFLINNIDIQRVTKSLLANQHYL